MYKYIIILLMISTFKAQETAPLPVEGFLGNHRFAFSTVINKKFAPESRFGFFSVMSYAAGYENNVKEQDFITNANVNYILIKNFTAVLGISIISTAGFHGTAGFQYHLQTKDLMVIVSPVIDIDKNYNMEALGIFQYTPRLSSGLKLFAKAQGFYNRNLNEGLHARSYAHFRLGLSHGIFTYGLASNTDFYGPAKIRKENYGAFVKVDFP